MRFGPWSRLLAAADALPPGPGVLQVRREHGLAEYPRGRSAMILYRGCDDLRATAQALAAAHPDAAWLCRCNRDPVADPHAAAARLVAEFAERFGGPPSIE